MINIILHEPEIPENTANIGRTCVCANAALHLIEPLGFQLTKEKIKRAGMDYWDRLDLHRYSNYENFIRENNISFNHDKNNKIWLATTKAHKTYADVKFEDNDYIMFGKESAGIPEEILAEHEENCIRIPMAESERSLNLANSVAIVLYEALRQNHFFELEKMGELHKLAYRK